MGGLEVAPGVGWGQRGSRENPKETTGLSEVSVDNMKEIFPQGFSGDCEEFIAN